MVNRGFFLSNQLHKNKNLDISNKNENENTIIKLDDKNSKP